MTADKDRVEAESKERRARERAQRQRLVWIGMATASYALDTLFLALFAAAGTISGNIALVYGAGAAAISASLFALVAGGWNLRFADASLVKPMTFLGIAMQLGIVLAAPQVAFPFLANLFTVFSFGMIWLSLRDSTLIWSLGAIGTAAVFYLTYGRMGIPSSSPAALTLVWIYFTLVLGRSLLLSVTSNQMRARLADSRRRLAASLEQVQQLASRDDLTGILNRRSLLAALERECGRAERGGAPLGIAMIDLDHFKRVNDTHGHTVGDEVLRAFARSVHESMRTTDVFGRFGGEEFMMILIGDTPELTLKAVERVRGAIAAKDWSVIAPDLPITLSAGIASHRKGETVEELIRRADRALYHAKDAGRNTIIFDPK